MDEKEARKILAEHLARYRARSYAELVPLVEAHETETMEVKGLTGAEYQMEFNFFWDDKPNGDVRVIGSIDDGGWWRAHFPLTLGFILSPAGKFVGE